MPENGEIRFDYEQVLVGRDGEVDHDNAVIRGASLIKTGEAEGHGLVVDQTLLRQLQVCGKEKGKVSINLDHGSGITSTCGYVTGFRIDGEKLRGDIHLLRSHKETPVILERAEKMPECFGLSVAFRPPDGNMKGDPMGNGKFAARCDKLMSVDLVCRPAANAGLFSVPSVDSSLKNMAEKKAAKEVKFDEAVEPTLQDVLAAVNELKGRLDQQDQFNQHVTEHLGIGEPSLQDLVDASDEELAQLGLTRAEVDAAVQEVLAGMEGQGTEGEISEGATGTEGETVGATAAGGADFSPAGASSAGAGAGASSELASLKKEVVQLQNKQKLVEMREKQKAEEAELSSIEKKVMILAEQRDTAVKLAEKLEAENDALRLAVRTGTRPVKAGVDNGMRMFSANDNGELHEFQQLVKAKVASGKSEAEAIMLSVKENPSLHADWLQSQKNKPATAA